MKLNVSLRKVDRAVIGIIEASALLICVIAVLSVVLAPISYIFALATTSYILSGLAINGIGGLIAWYVRPYGSDILNISEGDTL